MESEPRTVPCFLVRISRREPEAFGWEIYRNADSIEVERSTSLFATRVEAIIDSARAAALLNKTVIEPSSVEGENPNGD